MAEDRTEQQDNQTMGQQSQSERQENGQRPFVSPDGNEQSSVGSGAGSGQPLGDNDSACETGTTLGQGIESPGDETLIQSGSSQDSLDQSAGGDSGFSDTDRQGSGFIGAQGSGSDDYLQQSQNPELSREDALDQQGDDGMGLAGSEDQGNS